MSSNYYDAVVLGMEIGPLCAAALLVRRGFRVLVAGQGSTEDNYFCAGYRFSRRPFQFCGVRSPVVRRILDELNLSQPFARALISSSPRFQIVTSSSRVDIHEEAAKTGGEIAREMQDAADGVEPLLKELGRLSREFEKIIANDLVIPPESFFERRDLARAEVQNPFSGNPQGELMDILGLKDPLRDWLRIPMRVESGSSPCPGPLRQSRQIGTWLFDAVRFSGGRDALRAMFIDRITAGGGDVQPSATVRALELHRGRVRAVRLVGREEPTSCQCVLSSLCLQELGALIPPSDWTGRFRAQIEDEQPDSFLCGYALNLGLDPEVIPAGMSDCVLLSTGPGDGEDMLRIERIDGQADGRAALHVSCMVPHRSVSRIESGALRDSVLDRLRWLVPFLDNHLNVIHSPHDHCGPISLRGALEGITPALARPESVPKWRIRRPDPPGAFGIAGLPYRTGIKGLYLCGDSVISGLGIEGEFISAWGAARILSRTDPGRHRLLRSIRTPVEY